MKKAYFFSLGFTALIAGFSGFLFSEMGVMHVNDKKAFRLGEPLLIAGVKQNSYSILPEGTVMYYEKSWDEGHSTYHVYFNFKGEFKSTRVDNPGIDPIWLRAVPRDELPKLLADYPVSREQLVSILKAQRLTKRDLVQILRDWKE